MITQQSESKERPERHFSKSGHRCNAESVGITVTLPRSAQCEMSENRCILYPAQIKK